MSESLDLSSAQEKGLFVPPELVKVIVGYCSPDLLLQPDHEEPDQVVAERFIDNERLLSNLRLVSAAFKDSVDRLESDQPDVPNKHKGLGSLISQISQIDCGRHRTFPVRAARHLLRGNAAAGDIDSSAPLLALVKTLQTHVIRRREDVATLNSVLLHCHGLLSLTLRLAAQPKDEAPTPILQLSQGLLSLTLAAYPTYDEEVCTAWVPVDFSQLPNLADVVLHDLSFNEAQSAAPFDFRNAGALKELAFLCVTGANTQDEWDASIAHLSRTLPSSLSTLLLANGPGVVLDLQRIFEGRHIETLHVMNCTPASLHLGSLPGLKVVHLTLLGTPERQLQPGMLADFSATLRKNPGLTAFSLNQSSLCDSHLEELDLRGTSVWAIALSDNAFTENGLRSFFRRLPREEAYILLDVTRNAIRLPVSLFRDMVNEYDGWLIVRHGVGNVIVRDETRD